jgi:glycine/D-amino acid oxidase-like deaminating enzyme
MSSGPRTHPTVFERHPPAPGVVDHALTGTRQGVFWLDDLPERPEHPALDSSTSADLAIVGGGYTGLWTALLARERMPGARIVLLEGRRVGWAASGRNGGFCEASLTHGRANGEERWPEEVDRLDRLGLRNLDGIERTVAEHGMDAEFERTGTLDVAVEPHQAEWLKEEAAAARERGDTTVELLDGAATRAELDSPTFLSALQHRDTAALVHPAKLSLELARVAREQGVEIHEHTPVRELRTGRGGAVGAVELETDAAVVRADRVVLGTNAFPSLLRRNRLMTVPVYDYVLATEPLTTEQWDAIGWRNRQGVGDAANQFHYYRPTADGRIVFGGYDAIYHWGRRVRPRYEERPETFARLAGHFFTTFPQLEGVRFTHRWAGAIDTCTRFCAFFGTARAGRVAYAAGFTGLGVGATRFAAEVMLDRLGGTDTELTELRMVRERPLPFPPEPLAAAGINAVRWSLDRADHQHGHRNLLLRTLDRMGLGFDS